MKSTGLVVSEKGKVLLQEFELPDPRPGMLLEAAYSTLSPGTERNIVLGISPPLTLPVAIGYSMAARVKAVGPGVTQYRVGDAVVTTGRHATYLLADERFVTPVPEGTDLEQAAFFNLAHTALYGVRQAKVDLGEAVAVIGQGVVGLIVARIAQLAGGLPVIAIDIDDKRLELSRKLGIQEVVNGTDSARLKGILAGLPGGGVPVVIEVTGARQPVEQALEIVNVRGRVVLLGTTHGDETVQFHQPLSMKGASLIGGYVNSKPWSLSQTDVEMPTWPPSLASGSKRYVGPNMWTSDEDVRVVLNLIRYGSLDLRPLITHRFTPEQAPGAYQMVIDQDRSLVGGVIRWK
jgi:2-desacetyl-2-hydroxyethyl bacteriochlorophyllide A dehydrogenase